MHLVLSLLVVVFVVISLVDAITRDDSQVKHLPKVAWVLFIVFLPFIGSILWFALGREWNTAPREALSFGDPRRWANETPQQPAARPRDPRSTEQQLADLEREIELERLIQERRARQRGDETQG